MKPWIWASSILLVSGGVTMGVYAMRSLPATATLRDTPDAGIASASPKDRATRDRDFVIHLDAAPSSIIGPLGRALDVWSYNATVPGPTIRVRVGQPLRVEVSNHLPQPTSVHWHGLRLPNAMDGVPAVTQASIAPGASFTYRFVPRDAGTFWYHSHQNSSEQVERGLYGAFIVEDESPLPFTRDVVWVLDDWQLGRDGQIEPTFGTAQDRMHDRRVGNVVTVNGHRNESLVVRPGERIRVRMIDVANGRIFSPRFSAGTPEIVAVDGMYAARPQPLGDFEVAPGNRVDVDFTVPIALAGTTIDVLDDLDSRSCSGGHGCRGSGEPIASIRVEGLPVSTPPFPSPARASLPAWTAGLEAPVDVEFVLSAEGGHHAGITWRINGNAFPEHHVEHLVAGRWTKLRYVNQSRRIHPMHLHGQFFRVLARNGQHVDEPFWRDTVVVHPREIVDIALVPLDAGHWALHCHVLEHADAGMMTVVDVTEGG